MSRSYMRQRCANHDVLITIGRLNPEQCATIFSGQYVEKPVRPLTHVANALFQILQHRFAPQLLPFFVEDDALKLDLDFVRCSLPNVGGITELIRICALCETHDIGIVPHSTG